MFDRLSRSWQLYKASWSVLRQDRQLLVFPLISAVAALAVIGSFALGALGLWAAGGLAHAGRDAMPAMGYAAGFLFYVCLYFVMFFCNAALVGAALIRFDGGTPTVRDGLRLAAARTPQILGYAVIAATVGVLLRMIQERVGFLGRLVVGMLGVGWTVATSMVVPVLVSRDVGPVDAVKESAGLLKKTWGENVIGQAGLSAVFTLIHLGLGMAGAAGLVAAILGGNALLIALAVAFLVIAQLLTALVHSALSGIYAAALYRYATGGATGTSGFGAGTLQAAFAPKG